METALGGSARPTLAGTWELDLDSVTFARFAHLIVERSLEHLGGSSWPTERMTFEGLFDRMLTSQSDGGRRAAVLDLGEPLGVECLVHVCLVHGRIHPLIAARNVDTLASARSWLRERYPVASVAGQRIGITFWSMSSHGGRRSTRQVDVPSWEEISANYPASVEPQLTGLMGGAIRSAAAGRLVLWHGEPGTGKTYALRALGWEWREWCDLHYVTDPETFFGSSPAYMLDVLLSEDDEDPEKHRWRLLVLEDTGELLAADAKERTGQGLSRLLNVVDGLLGQGLRVLVLVTTNETLRSLHPAVARPGRCASCVEFVPFSPEEAEAWLERNGGGAGGRAGTLASLYARAAGIELPERRKVGFVR